MAMFSGGKVMAKLGVRPVVNAQGNLTTLGGSTSPAEIRAAMDEANEHWYEMEELLEKSGEFIAGVLGTESAYVTSGCAAALTLSTAACMAGDDPDKIGQLPDTTGMKNEFLIQKAQRYDFDRCFTLAGGKLVEVGGDEGCTAEELAAAIGPNTAAIAYPVQTDWGSSVLPLDEAVRVAHEQNVPVIADAASQIYPLEYFQGSAQGADLVCFGAKYFGAPHSSGIVTGKKGLVHSVVRQGFVASKGRATSALAGAQHGREHTGPSWAGASTETATARGSVGRALCLCAQPQRRLGHRLQRVVPHRRRRSHRPAHRAGRRLAVPAGLQRASAAQRASGTKSP